MDHSMMHMPLGTGMILSHSEHIHAQSRIGQFDGTDIHWRSFAETAQRARQFMTALQAAGVQPNDRMATLSWNDFAHFEAYLAVPALGAVLHTLNLRLHAEQIGYIMADAEDQYLLADATLLADLIPELNRLDALKLVIVTGDIGLLGELEKPKVAYEDFIAAHEPMLDLPQVDEQSAAAACYTSGTTGHPKGVVYSHRTIYLHSLASMAANAFGLSEADRILLLPPMFHANAWGLPFSGWLAGADFILPSSYLQPDMIRQMIALSAPSFTATVPTIVNDLLRMDEEQRLDMSSFRLMVVGGSAMSEALLKKVEQQWGIPLIQGWGMTETSPLCVLSHPAATASPDEARKMRAKSGRPVAGVFVRLVDDEGQPVAQDGQKVGKLQLKGPWIAKGYHRGVGSDVLTDDGWLNTGDAGTIDARGYVQVTDRLKDLIKSGGEWIPSAELENIIMGLPEVNLAAIIGVADPRWEERPLAIVTSDDGTPPNFAQLRTLLQDEVARFWIPEYWAHVENLPLTSVGKIDKQALRKSVENGDILFERVDRFQ